MEMLRRLVVQAMRVLGRVSDALSIPIGHPWQPSGHRGARS